MWRFAFNNLFSRPARSGLALLGLSVAVAGMVGLMSIAAGLQDMVDRTFSQMPGVVAMQPGAPIPLVSRLPAAWADEIAELPGVAVVQPELWARAHLINGEMAVSPPRLLFGADLDAMSRLSVNVFADSLLEGRFLDSSDQGTMNTVISRPISEEYGRGVGDTLNVDGHSLNIVGIYECGTLLLDVVILVDMQTLRQMTFADDKTVSSIYIEPAAGTTPEQLSERIQEHFRGRTLPVWDPTGISNAGPGNSLSVERAAARAVSTILEGWLGIRPGSVTEPEAVDDPAAAVEGDALPEQDSVRPAPADANAPTRLEDNGLPAETANASEETNLDETPVIEVRTTQEWGERVNDFTGDLDLFLYLMTAIALSTAVVSVVNTMLMSVSERLVEFGVLRANGWSQRDVLLLVCRESGLLGLWGGVLGASLGWFGTHVVNATFPLKAHLVADLRLLAFSVLFSTILGIAGGLYPAFWAARVSPMEAIRKGA